MSQSRQATAGDWVIPAWRRRQAWPFLAAAGLSIVIGGLVAAVATAVDWSPGAWVAAYLVLVGGVAQVALIAGQVGLVPRRGMRLWPQLVGWNVADLLVILGTLTTSFALVLVGSVGLVAVLVAFWAGTACGPAAHRVLLVLYRLFVIFLAVSTVIGCVFALR